MKISDKSKSNDTGSFAHCGSGHSGSNAMGTLSIQPLNDEKYQDVTIALTEKLILIQQQQQQISLNQQHQQQISLNQQQPGLANKIVLPKGIIRFKNSSSNRVNSTGSKSAEKTTRKGGQSHEPREESLRRKKKVIQIIRNFEKDKIDNNQNFSGITGNTGLEIVQ